MKILAIDPGPMKSAWLVYEDGVIRNKCIETNDGVLDRIKFMARRLEHPDSGERLVVEMVQSFGMSVGQEIFETVFWTGRFCEAWSPGAWQRIGRIAIKNHLCHTSRAKDSNIRQALIDRFGPPGTKREPGITYGISKDLWSCLAIACTWADLHPEGK